MGLRIKDKLQNRNQPISYSMEFVCPKTEQGVVNLVERINRMVKLSPLFVDITWNAGGSRNSGDTPLELVDVCQQDIGVDTCMHMTCVGMSEQEVNKALETAYNSGCRNILALRGDLPRAESDEAAVKAAEAESGPKFQYAKDLIRHIKAKYGDEMSIVVAGYPEGHPEESDPNKLIEYLKEKCDAGADLIVTQMFYNADIFIDWCHRVRAAGITTPIAPGIMPVSGWASFLRRAKWCQIDLPQSWYNELEPLNHDDEAVRNRGTELVAEMCEKIVQNTDVTHLHIYTMNLEKSPVMVLDSLNLIVDENETAVEEEVSVVKRKPTSRLRRGSSLTTVKPIHWRNRPASYNLRTATWDEFPNGRWGDSRSPAFNQLNELDVLLKVSRQSAEQWWGFPTCAQDVGQLVIGYLTGRIASLPWSDTPAADEVTAISNELRKINDGSTGQWFSINSQPAINAVDSADPVYGWGPKHGYVYQKANLEVMVHPEMWEHHLKPLLSKVPFYEAIYYAVDSKSEKLVTNAEEDTVNAITWGIFPGKEVVQPTIVEGTSFLAWKDEAFRIAHEWSRFYPSTSPSAQFLREIAQDWWLVNIVHHNFHDAQGLFRMLGIL